MSAAGPIAHRIHAWDGLPLAALEWDIGSSRLPLLCLPGLVRTAGDFANLAEKVGAGRRVIAIDYPGRGASGRARRVARYAPEACLRDITDICAALHVPHAVAVGTSFGGLLAMGLAALRPGLIAAAILNDIGPEIGKSGADFVRAFIARDPAFPDLETSAAFLRANLPQLSLQTDEDWQRMAALTYAPGSDGLWHPLWDTRIAALLDGKIPDLWSSFGALDHVPVLLLRGAVSDILLPETVERMCKRRPDMEVIELADIGHAPTLDEPECRDAVSAFLDRIE